MTIYVEKRPDYQSRIQANTLHCSGYRSRRRVIKQELFLNEKFHWEKSYI
jgi:hypothetical protein